MESPEYFWAFIVGLLFIALFARDRLYVRIDEKSEQRNRFIELLEPSKLVRRKMFWRGLFIYFLLLSLIYLSLCALSHPLFPVIQQIFPDFWERIGFSEVDQASSPAIPLIASMAVVGLLPQVLWIKRLEEIARRVTLRLVSIPDSFNDLTDALFRIEFKPDALPTTSQTMFDRVKKIARRIDDFLPDAFFMKKALIKHQLFLHVLGELDVWPEQDVKRQFQSIWSDIYERAVALETDLSDLADRSQLPADAGDRERKALAASWDVISKRLKRIADDVCALIAIYAENSRSLPKRQSAPDAHVDQAERQRDDGLEELRRVILAARSESDQSQKQFTLALISTGAACIVLFIVGFLGSLTGLWTEIAAYEMVSDEVRAESSDTKIAFLEALSAGVVWLFGSALTYLPAALVAWGVKLRLDDQGEWRDSYDKDEMTQVQKVGFYWRVFWPAYLTSAACLFFTMVAVAIARTTDASVISNWGISWNDVFMPFFYGLLGGIYAVSLILVFDFNEMAYAEDKWVKASDVRELMVWTLASLALATALGCLAQSFASDNFTNAGAQVGFYKELAFKVFSALVFGALSIYLTLINLNDLRRIEARRRKLRNPKYDPQEQEARA